MGREEEEEMGGEEIVMSFVRDGEERGREGEGGIFKHALERRSEGYSFGLEKR